MSNSLKIEELYHSLLEEGYVPHTLNGYEILQPDNLEILTYGGIYKTVNFVSRHKTSKHLLDITVKSNIGKNHVKVTTDHICMIYTREHFFENTNAKNLRIDDIVSVYDNKTAREIVGTIIDIDDLGPTDEWLYDIEVADDKHCFYANDILVHNSQFINLQCVSEYLKRKHGLTAQLSDWPEDIKRELWDTVSKFVEDKLNPYVRELIASYTGSKNANMLSYELEYMTDAELIESKKHYALHKIFEEGDRVDKFKFSGIELKKASIPKQMKVFLKDFYEGVLIKNWTFKDYKSYICDLYEQYRNFGIDDIAMWKGYNTAREAVGFLTMGVGTTGIAKACTYYNQLIKKLKIAEKYEEILVGEKVRFLYVDPSNKYGIECLAFKDGQYPKEFEELFRPDYRKMFAKLITEPLKNYRNACHFPDVDPTDQMVEDIFEL